MAVDGPGRDVCPPDVYGLHRISRFLENLYRCSVLRPAQSILLNAYSGAAIEYTYFMSHSLTVESYEP